MTDFWYNMSAISGDDGVLGLMQTVNDVFFFHLFGTFILIVLFIIIFRAAMVYNNNPKVSFMYTAFFLAILSILFKLMNLCYDATVYIFVVVFLISLGLQFLLD